MLFEFLAGGLLLALLLGDDEPGITPTVGHLDLPPTGPTPTPPAEPADAPEVVFAGLLKATPQANSLYQLKPGDNPLDVAQSVTGAPDGSPLNTAYLRQVIQSAWNWYLYTTEGNPAAPFSAGVEDEVTGQSVYGQLGAAFLPMHEPVLAALEAGRLPQRIPTWDRNPQTGAPGIRSQLDYPRLVPARLGVLWLPAPMLAGPDVAPPEFWRTRVPAALLAAGGWTVEELVP